MIGNFNQIDRHPGEVLSVQGRSITLSDAASIEADVTLWGTGYELDLGFLDSPALAGVTHVNQLTRRCGALFRSLDIPRFFCGHPGDHWIGAVGLRTIRSHDCRAHPRCGRTQCG